MNWGRGFTEVYATCHVVESVIRWSDCGVDMHRTVEVQRKLRCACRVQTYRPTVAVEFESSMLATSLENRYCSPSHSVNRIRLLCIH